MFTKRWLELPKECWYFAISNLLIRIGGGIIPFLVLLFRRDFSIGNNNSDLLYIFILVSIIPSVLIGGKIVDNYSKKNIIIFFRFLYIVALIVYIVMGISIVRLLSLVVASISIGISNPSINTMIIDLVDDNHKEVAYSLVLFTTSVAEIISPIISGLSFNNGNLLFLFYIIFALIGCLVLSLVKYKEENRVIIYNEVKTQKIKVNSIYFLKDLIIPLMAITIFEFALSQQNYSLPLFIQSILSEHGEAYFGYILSINAFVVCISTPVFATFLSKTSSEKMFVVASILCGIGLGALSFIREIKYIIIACIIWSLGNAIYNIFSLFFIMEAKNKMTSAKANTLILACRSGGMIIGVLISSSINKIGGYLIWVVIFILYSLMTTYLISKMKFFKQ